MEAHSYKTISGPAEGIYKEKGSKFLAYAQRVNDENEAKEFFERIRKEHLKCRHHCYAYRIGTDFQPDGTQGQLFRMNDAGEPSGTAGRPILNQIDARGLTNVMVIVVRYFGGTLLGASGLANAYKTAADDALNHAAIIEKKIQQAYLLHYEYEDMGEVMNHLKRLDVDIVEQKFELKCLIKLQVDKVKEKSLLEGLHHIKTVQVERL